MVPIRSQVRLILRRAYSHGKPAASAPIQSAPNLNVAGLSNKCVKPTNEPVGPGASRDGVYKVPEYFCYDRFSYSEAEVEMAKFRCPQPSASTK